MAPAGNGQTIGGGCASTADCPTGLYCDTSGFACAVSDGYGDPTQVACGSNADCKALGVRCDLVSHVCQSGNTNIGAAPEAAPIQAAECVACTSNADCTALDSSAGCWLTDASGAFAFCGVDCSNGNACPANSQCVLDTHDSGSTCQPQTTSGTCADWGSVGGSSTGGSSGDGSSGGSTGGVVTGSSGGSTGGSSGGSSGGTTGGPACTADTWDNFANGFFANNCAGCHHPFNFDQAGVSANAKAITSKISKGAMPPAPATLDPTDETRILTWLGCGMP